MKEISPIEISTYFKLNAEISSAQPFGSGHINDTYHLLTIDKQKPDYLLQKVNHQVFKQVPNLMNNIDLVTKHVHEKTTLKEVNNGQTTLTLISTNAGQLYHQDSSGNYWRVYEFLNDLKSYDFPETTELVYEGGIGFGRFIRQLEDFPPSRLHTTIPRFHDIIHRLSNFKKAITENFENRKREIKRETNYIWEVAEQLSTMQHFSESGKIPKRVTHNDTKFNNILLDTNNKCKCVIDLDTVMPGLIHYDFGDGVRTTINTTKEDEEDLNNVHIDLDRFKAFSFGYLEMTREILTPIEINYLGLSAPLLSYMMGVRFLTDYLLGDVYYKTDFHKHNLQRARCQLELTKKMLEQLEGIQQIVNEQVSRSMTR